MSADILEMTLGDYDEVVALWTASEGVGEAESRDEIATFLRRNPGFSFVARAGSDLAGAVLCGHDGRRGYLYHLAVAPEFRNQGIARNLVRRCLHCLRQISIRRCSIHLYVDNDAGRSFWKQIGWRDRDDLHVMAIDLPLAP